jgi:sortase (surface protein transpeptidase)
MPDGTVYTYVIESMEILESTEDLRIPTIEGKHMMLTTCYPFYYTGHAPKKLIVLAKVT